MIKNMFIDINYNEIVVIQIIVNKIKKFNILNRTNY